MTKKEIARLVYNNTQLSLVDSQEAVQATFEAISKLLVRYGRVELRGFGVFAVQERAARKAHNPRTGEEVQVDAHRTVVFKPSKLMKAEIQVRRTPEKPAKDKKAPAKAKNAPEPVKAKKAPAPAKKTPEKPVAKAPAKKTTKKSAK